MSKVVGYSQENLLDLLHDEKYTSKKVVKKKKHFIYLLDYLGPEGLNAKYIVVEENYRSKDYLSDYSKYYSLCFKSYKQVCRRLHFFNSELSQVDFKNKFEKTILEGASDADDFWRMQYLGFIVVKPIPNSIIGYTVLKHYNFKSDLKCYDANRDYWGTKEYKIHLYGNEIKLESLAFQEQDRALAACATIAIWSMLQRAAEDYHVILKSPGEITTDTGTTSHNGNRLFPNNGLVTADMCKAITLNGLVTEVRDDSQVKDFNQYLKKLINAYSPLKIPLILIIKVPINGELMGHAVTICGHSSESAIKVKKGLLGKIFNKNPMLWLAEKIDKIYVHDDQWGPFTRISFIGANELKSPWTEKSNETKNAKPVAVIIPVLPKLRISYDDIEPIIIWINELLILAYPHFKTDLVWDIKIQHSEDFKRSVQNSDLLDNNVNLDRDLRYRILQESMPKYIWVCTCYSETNEIVVFTFDATGLANDMLGLKSVFYYSEIKAALAEFLALTKNNVDLKLPDNYLDWLINEVQ